MKNRFGGRDFLSLMDFSAEEIGYFLETASDLKRKWAYREPHEYLRGRTIGVIFECPGLSPASIRLC